MKCTELVCKVKLFTLNKYKCLYVYRYSIVKFCTQYKKKYLQFLKKTSYGVYTFGADCGLVYRNKGIFSKLCNEQES